MEITLKNEEEYENALEKVESMLCKDLSEEQLEYFEALCMAIEQWIRSTRFGSRGVPASGQVVDNWNSQIDYDFI